MLWQRCAGVPMNFYLDRGMFIYQHYCGRPSIANAELPITQKLLTERCE